MSRRREPWYVFLAPDGRELCAITVRGSFDGEIAATIDLLACENGINPASISVTEVMR